MDKLKATAQDVAAEAKKATAQGKSKLDQIQLRKKADDVAKRLGYLVHAERTKGAQAGAEADRLIAEISELETEIVAAEADTSAAAELQAAAPAEPAPTTPPSTPPPPSGGEPQP